MGRVVNSRLLLVEDDVRLAELTATYLEQAGFDVVTVCRGDEAVNQFDQVRPDAVILDLMLPGLDGVSVCREIRQRSAVPILMFTAKDSDLDQVLGLESGADDYVTKPVDPIVLLARMRALLRRNRTTSTSGPAADDLVLGGLRIGQRSQSVWLNGTLVDLTTHEFELLQLLASHAGQVLSRQEIFQKIRGIEYDGLDRSIDGRVSKLRRKLGDDPSTPQRIKTIWGKGYLLVPDAWESDV
ncbi:MAG: response regulator transcription factor [Pseudomonadota bacterium]